jgi:hypothetical protein
MAYNQHTDYNKRCLKYKNKYEELQKHITGGGERNFQTEEELTTWINNLIDPIDEAINNELPIEQENYIVVFTKEQINSMKKNNKKYTDIKSICREKISSSDRDIDNLLELYNLRGEDRLTDIWVNIVNNKVQ